MLRIANVPEREFEGLVEAERPPSAKRLAELGTQKQERSHPEPYRNEWTDWTWAVKHLAAVPKMRFGGVGEA
jgi:hypothetical protein